MPVLKLRRVDKNGAGIYSLEGLRSSIYVSKGMFAAEPPPELPIDYDGFAQPGEVRVTKEMTPEEVEKLQLRAAKAEENAKKAEERAAKARARAEKYAKGETVTA